MSEPSKQTVKRPDVERFEELVMIANSQPSDSIKAVQGTTEEGLPFFASVYSENPATASFLAFCTSQVTSLVKWVRHLEGLRIQNGQQIAGMVQRLRDHRDREFHLSTCPCVPCSIVNRYDQDLAAGGKPPAFVGRLNVYKCTTCSTYIVTVDRANGVTPMMLSCKVEGCGGMMQSSFYRVPQNLSPTWEW
jgi:hypothetical protein